MTPSEQLASAQARVKELEAHWNKVQAVGDTVAQKVLRRERDELKQREAALREALEVSERNTASWIAILRHICASFVWHQEAQRWLVEKHKGRQLSLSMAHAKKMLDLTSLDTVPAPEDR